MILDRSGNALPAIVIQRILDQERAILLDAQPHPPVVEAQVQPSERGRVCQYHELVLLAPRGVRRGRIGKAEAEDAIPRNPPFGEYGQGVARLGRETLHGVAIQGNDGRHGYYMEFF